MFDDIWPEHGNFFGESSAGTREITWSFPRPLQLELLAIAPDMPQMTKAKRFGDHGDPRCVYVYIYIYVIIFIHYIILYIYTTGNIYIYIYIGEVWRVQVGLSWLRSWCSTWFCEPGKLTNKLSWGYCMYTSHDVQWKTQPKESQQNIAKQCCLMMSSWQTKILLAASC